MMATISSSDPLGPALDRLAEEGVGFRYHVVSVRKADAPGDRELLCRDHDGCGVIVRPAADGTYTLQPFVYLTLADAKPTGDPILGVVPDRLLDAIGTIR